jgi:hypothetical protein
MRGKSSVEAALRHSGLLSDTRGTLLYSPFLPIITSLIAGARTKFMDTKPSPLDVPMLGRLDPRHSRSHEQPSIDRCAKVLPSIFTHHFPSEHIQPLLFTHDTTILENAISVPGVQVSDRSPLFAISSLHFTSHYDRRTRWRFRAGKLSTCAICVLPLFMRA